MKIKYICLYFVVMTISLNGCILPYQKFSIGSDNYVKANPSVKNKDLGRNHLVLISVIDTGVNYNHTHLQQNIRQNTTRPGVGLDILGEDFFPYPIVISPEDGSIIEILDGSDNHGTHVAGIALLGGVYNLPKLGKVSVGPLIGLLPIRAIPVGFSASEMSDAEQDKLKLEKYLIDKIIYSLEKSIRFSISEGVDIINMSLAINGNDLSSDNRKILDEKMNNIIFKLIKNEGKDILFVFAAGNDSIIVHSNYYPASFKAKNTITVGALKNKNSVAEFTNYGDLVDIYINGSNINSLYSKNSRGKMTGTSMSAPLISNLAAKLKLIAPCLHANEIKNIIINTGKKITIDFNIKHLSKIASFKKAIKRAYIHSHSCK